MVFDEQMKKVPVILDTDIGNDIDDSWALTFLLKSPEIDLQYILAATGDTEYRARIIAKMLLTAGRTDIPIGIGRATRDLGKTLESWLGEFDLKDWPGTVHSNGATELVRVVMSMEKSPVILCIGPMTNLADALDLEPKLAGRCHLVAMSGSIARHEDGRDGQIAEWNVRQDITSARKVYSAPWKSIRIAPLDSCGILRLNGDDLQRVRKADCRLVRSLMESVDCWARSVNHSEWPERSSILFDTVAAYLCFETEHLKMERLNLLIDEQGFMRRSAQGAAVDCALDWQDINGFKQMLAERLTENFPVRGDDPEFCKLATGSCMADGGFQK